jgi:hypothetical protein
VITSVDGATATTKVSFTIFANEDTVTGTGYSIRTTNPDGTVTARGTRTITGGTGAYRGASGQLTLTATAVNGITTSHWDGSIRYGTSGSSGHRQAHKKYDFTFTVRSVAVFATGNPPVNGSDTQASLVDGTLAGSVVHGAGRGVNTFPKAGVGDTVGTVFGPDGSVNFTLTATGRPNPDGSFSFQGKGKITGGTGAYKGATGTFRELRGRAPRNGPSTAMFTGTITY